MAALIWAAVLLSVLVPNSEAVDATELAGLVTNLLNVYRPNYRLHGDTPVFTLAVSVPFNTATRRYDFSQVTAADSSQNVKNALDNCRIYEGNRVVGAMLLKWPDVKNQCPNEPIPAHWTFVPQLCPNARTWADLNQQCTSSIGKKLAKSENGAVDHAEYRVFQRFNHLVNKLNTGALNRNDLMLFYTYKAPCDARCSSLTNVFSIVQSIRSINSWPNHVVVFSNIFVPVRTSFTTAQLEANRRTSLTNIGNAINGVGNIYRCPVGSNQCTNCAATTGVADACVSDNRSRSPSPNGK